MGRQYSLGEGRDARQGSVNAMGGVATVWAAARLKTVEVGTYEQWLKLSDHCPVVIEVLDSSAVG